MSPREWFVVLVGAGATLMLLYAVAGVTMDRRLADLECDESVINEHGARLLALESHVDLKWEGP